MKYRRKKSAGCAFLFCECYLFPSLYLQKHTCNVFETRLFWRSNSISRLALEGSDSARIKPSASLFSNQAANNQGVQSTSSGTVSDSLQWPAQLLFHPSNALIRQPSSESEAGIESSYQVSVPQDEIDQMSISPNLVSQMASHCQGSNNVLSRHARQS